MVIYEDNCVGCPPHMGCLGSACPNKNSWYAECDECGTSDSTIYEFEGEELCINCIKERLDEVKG